MLYKNELFRPVETGDHLKAYVKKVREDQKIDVSLQKQGYDEAEAASEKIVEALQAAGGFLPLSDKSSPEDIYAQLQISKKTFKKAIGALYKQRKITLSLEGIRLL
jgi:predicted RNA-binding protein (virulence factor B family)